MSSFNIGDWVEVLDDDISGTVKCFNSDGRISIETEDGFELTFLSNELVGHFDDAIEVDRSALQDVIVEETSSNSKKRKSTKH